MAKKKRAARAAAVKPGGGRPGQSAQTLPVVLMMAAVLAVFSTTLVWLLHYAAINMVNHQSIIAKDELASIALEHAMYKLQVAGNWDQIPLKNFNYDHEFTVPDGNYTIYINKGNLFTTGLSSPVYQGQTNYRTIGIKVKTTTGSTGAYYAVVEQVNFGGPIVSKGKINMSATTSDVDTNGNPDFYAFWGDIYSANPTPGYCILPMVPTGSGDWHPQDWMPQVYAKSDIYTCSGTSGSGRSATVTFADFYTDMTPSANCHPYSEFAVAPDVDLDYYKNLAFKNKSYYGPANVPGVGANPYYVSDGAHNTYNVTNANVSAIINSLTQTATSVVFIDTTDGLPLRPTGASCNSYAQKAGAHHIEVTADDGSDGTVVLWKSGAAYYTKGLLFVQGPLVMEGTDPDNDGHSTPGSGDLASVITGVPDNYYYPRRESNRHFYYNSGTPASSYLGNVNHQGVIYTGGELQLGGSSSSDNDVCIYGSVYIGPLGILSDYSSNTPLYAIYYNPAINVFGYVGNQVAVMTFNEITFLVPTPVPAYPTF